jgi:nucleoporin NUP2
MGKLLPHLLPLLLFCGSSFSGFGVPAAKPAAEESGGSQEEEGAADGGADDSKSLPTKSHDEEGEGEEDEETTHTTKSKVYKLVKDDSSDDGKLGWKDMGVGEYARVNSVSRKSFSETLE